MDKLHRHMKVNSIADILGRLLVIDSTRYDEKNEEHLVS